MVQLKKGRAGLLGSMGSHRYGAAVLLARKSEFWCLARVLVKPFTVTVRAWPKKKGPREVSEPLVLVEPAATESVPEVVDSSKESHPRLNRLPLKVPQLFSGSFQ